MKKKKGLDQIYGLSNRGRREKNEDRVLAEKGTRVVAVADGLGGYEKGDVAAEMMIAQLEKLARLNFGTDYKNADKKIQWQITNANKQIYNTSKEKKIAQMGTTVSGAIIIEDNKCLFFNVGDSRTYLIDAYGITQQTRDHSQDMEALRDGTIKEEDVGKGPYSNALTRSIGTDQEVEVDIFPAQGFHELKEGEIIFCCTDGLWKVVSDQEIWNQILGRGNIKKALKSLISLALARGSNDNISMAVYVHGKFPKNLAQLPVPNGRRKVLKSQEKPPIPMDQGILYMKLKEKEKKKKLIRILIGAIILIIVMMVISFAFLFKEPKPSPTTISNKSKPITGTPPIHGTDTGPKVGTGTISKTDTGSITKSEILGGSISFSLRPDTYEQRVEISLSYENLKLPSGDDISSEVYYTLDGSEPTKENAIKYTPGEKIILNKPEPNIIKAKVFSRVGKYEGPVFSQKYIIEQKPKAIPERMKPATEKPEIPIETIKYPNNLDRKTLRNINENTKKIVFKVEGLNTVRRVASIIQMEIYISQAGSAKMLNISGVEVTPNEKEDDFRAALSAVIQKIKFSPPTIKRNPVNVQIWIDFNKVAYSKKEKKWMIIR